MRDHMERDPANTKAQDMWVKSHYILYPWQRGKMTGGAWVTSAKTAEELYSWSQTTQKILRNTKSLLLLVTKYWSVLLHINNARCNITCYFIIEVGIKTEIFTKEAVIKT